MLAAASKKIAEQYSFKQQNNVAYGEIMGYMTSVDENLNTKNLSISVYIPTEEISDQLYQLLNEKEVVKNFKIQDALVTSVSITISFIDNKNKAEKIFEFIEWFYPILSQSGALGTTHCAECGEAVLEYDKHLLMVEGTVFTYHTACAQRIKESIAERAEVKTKSNAGRGFIGALLGGLVGAIPWAIVYAFGWFVGWLGLLIGFSARKGYTLFGGKHKRIAVPILAVAIIISVLFGQVVGDALNLGYYITQGDFVGYTFADIPYMLSTIYTDGEYMIDFITNIAIGLLFAGFSVWGIFKEILATATDAKFKVLDLTELQNQ